MPQRVATNPNPNPNPSLTSKVKNPGREAKPNQPVPLGDHITMNYNLHLTQNSSRPRVLESQAADGGGAQAEPYMSVRSAHVRSGNPQTGCGSKGLAIPATVPETPNVPPEAEDVEIPGRGSSGDDKTDPLRSFLIGIEDDPDAKSDESDSGDKDKEPSISSKEDDPPNPVLNHQKRGTKIGPRSRPGITIASLNMRGRQKDRKNKITMVVDWIRTNRIAVLAVQETHLMEESLIDLNEKYRHLKFLGSGLSTSSGGIMFIINESAGTPQDIQFEVIEKGRSGILSLQYGAQEMKIVNVYMPNHKAPQREALIKLRRTLRARRDITDTEFFIMGDWNFVEDKVDRSPQHDNNHRVTNEMNKLKTSLDILDGWRTSNPGSRSFTWEGTFGSEKKKIFSRIDRIYTTRDTWEITNEYKMINCDFSDHDGVAVTVREASAAETGTGEAKLNRNITRHPLFEKEADRLLNKLERKLNKYK